MDDNKDYTGKKMNRKMANKAIIRSEKRFAGSLKILALLSKGSVVVSGPIGVYALQHKYGV